LSEATPTQRTHFELIGDGQGVHWPDLDEDISVEGMLHGVPAHRPQSLVHFRAFKINGIVNHVTKGWSERGKHVAHLKRLCSIEENSTSAS
jgi:hypothetical protein